MDPTSGIGVIVTALATGAATGGAEQLIRSSYEDLKKLIRDKFVEIDFKPLERKPESETQQNALAENLTDAGADKDVEVLRSAQELIKLIESKAPGAAEAVGVSIERLRAAGSVVIEDIVASGSGVVIKDIETQHNFTVKGVRAGQKSASDDPNA